MSKTERFSLENALTYVGKKQWLQDLAWKIYSKASKERGQEITWVDPFCGSCSLPNYILPEKARLSDLNPHLINFFKYIIKTGSMPDFSETSELDYYAKRERFNQKIAEKQINDDEMAQLFYYLNKAGYGGLSRYNKKGFFNVPYRGHISNPKTDFSLEQSVYRDWHFECIDWWEALYLLWSSEWEDDFIFIDPPYDNTFNKYMKAGFSWEEQVKLAEFLAKMKNPILATNSTTDRIIELYTDLGFDVQFRSRGNNMQRPKVRNGVHRDFKEAIFTKNIEISNG